MEVHGNPGQPKKRPPGGRNEGKKVTPKAASSSVADPGLRTLIPLRFSQPGLWVVKKGRDRGDKKEELR